MSDTVVKLDTKCMLANIPKKGKDSNDQGSYYR